MELDMNLIWNRYEHDMSLVKYPWNRGVIKSGLRLKTGNKPGQSCAKLRPASLLSLLFLVNSELCKSKVNKVKQFKGNILSESKIVQVR